MDGTPAPARHAGVGAGGSGACVALFLAIHVGAVLVGRAGGLDTNFYFAAAGLHVWPAVLLFAPHYFLAVAALFVHLGCALRRGRAVVAVSAGAGVVAAATIVAVLMGKVVPVEIPAMYLQTFGVAGG